MSSAVAHDLPTVQESWPPAYVDVFQGRAKKIEAMRGSRKVFTAMATHYKHNPVDFISDWLMTYDPRDAEMPHKPFILFKRQREFISWLKDKLDEQDDGLCDKSRDSGATFLCAAFALWLFIFWDGSKVGFGSRKEQYVDELGNPDSIFEKIRYMIKGLPKEFVPDIDDYFMKFVNKDNGSAIIGEAGDNIGRGGRSTIYFKDESAFYERPKRIEAALSANSNVKIDISTPNGLGNVFHQKRFSGDISVFTFHWTSDPRKTSGRLNARGETWYEEQKRKLDPVTFAQEVDIDYSASVEGICIPSEYVRAAVDFAMSDEGTHAVGFDVADEGVDANATVRRKGNVVQPDIDSWKKGNTTDNTRKVWAYCAEKGYAYLNYDSIGVGAGVKGEVSSLQRTAVVTVQCQAVSVSDAVPPGAWDVGRSNQDMFANFKAWIWWTVRRMFERTWERVTGVKHWEDHQCISIPNNPELIAELSQPLTEVTESGKYKIESKKAMKKRGIKSPNLADALMLAFVPIGVNSVGIW
jgi:phage terminase large subunit